MICIYDKKTLKNNFNNNGLAVLNECIKAEINNELNGDYSLELEYPANSRKAKYFVQFNIIKADNQLFRIYKIEKIQASDYRIRVWAKHIFYDLAYFFIESETVTQSSVKTAMEKALVNDLFLNYTVDSDIVINGSIEMNEINSAEAMFKIINQWGTGKLYRDNFEISILNKIGKNTGVLIKYGKNVNGIKITYDTTNIVTRLFPKGKNGVTLTEKYIDVPNWNSDDFPPFPIVKKVEFSNAYDEPTLRILAADIAKEIGLSNVNIEVDFIELSRSKEYKNFKGLQEVKVGDFVIVRNSKFNIDVMVEVIKIKKDILTGFNSKVELGQPKTKFNEISNMLQTVKDDLGNQVAKVASSIMYYSNTSPLTITTTLIQPIYLGVTAVTSTNLSMNLAIYGTASAACTLTINIQLDNKQISFTPKQKLQVGDNIIGIPLAIPQVREGAHYIGVYLSTDTGTFNIPLYNMQCLVDGRNLQGGLSSEPPHAELCEKISTIDIKEVSKISIASILFTMDELLNNQVMQDIAYFNIANDKISNSILITLS